MPPKKVLKVVPKEEVEKRQKKEEIIKREKEEKDIQEEIQKYISQLSDFEIKVLEIAKRKLESSFRLDKSIGFLEWQKSNI